jgi:hypothetical protein
MLENIGRGDRIFKLPSLLQDKGASSKYPDKSKRLTTLSLAGEL